MQRIVVKNFGPLKDIDLEIKDFMVFIGPNASGKSTLAKLIYFFLNVPENLAKAHLDSYGLDENDLKANISRSFWNYLGYNFPISYPEDSYIRFEYDSDKVIEFTRIKEIITLPFQITFSGKIDGILDYLIELKGFFEKKTNGINLESKSSSYTETKYQFYSEIKAVLNLEFSKVLDLKKYYFPEGRSNFNPDSDFHFEYQKSFAEIIKESQYFLRDILERGIPTDEIVEIIGGRIIKVDSNRFGLKLKTGEKVMLQLLSSGQKEVFWFLVSLFQIYKKDEPNYLFIEEPETHLFPDKQKNLLYYLVSLYKKSHSQLLITTHSHYIIGVINVLINAHRIGQLHPEKVEKVISKEYWLDKERVFVGRLKEGKLENVYSEEAEMFDHEELTQTSGLLNSEMDELYEIEFESENDKD